MTINNHLEKGKLYQIEYNNETKAIGIWDGYDQTSQNHVFIEPQSNTLFAAHTSRLKNLTKVDPTPTPTPTFPKFSTVVLDPPWNERGGGKIKRGADRHYPLLKTPDIIRVILQSQHWNQIAENAHMYMWVTNNFLPDGLHVIKALGFTYKTNFVWVKDRMGLGQYFRGMHEICLFATKGNRPTEPRTNDKSVPSVLRAERGKHSAKPLQSYELIERRSSGPYLEIFARSERDGWTSWGNEV
jgi:N6-adenosine-specific RNA methylase IME4